MSKPQRKSDRPRVSAPWRIARTVLVVLGLLVLAFVIAAFSGCCERLFYHPDAVVYSTPEAYGLTFQDVRFTSKDGTRLSGWFIPAVGRASGTIVHCHGNAQNMTSHWLFAKTLPWQGFNLFVFDYRGYGRSEGRPTRRGTVEDTQAAVDYVFARSDVDPRRVGLFGQSLGGALAVVVAAHDKRLRGLVIDSAFSSYRDEAEHVLRGNPVTRLIAWPLSRLLIGSDFDPIDCVADIAPRPLLVIHGAADQLVPARMGRALADKADPPKELWLVAGAGHTGAVDQAEEEFVEKVTVFFRKAFAVAED